MVGSIPIQSVDPDRQQVVDRWILLGVPSEGEQAGVANEIEPPGGPILPMQVDDVDIELGQAWRENAQSAQAARAG